MHVLIRNVSSWSDFLLSICWVRFLSGCCFSQHTFPEQFSLVTWETVCFSSLKKPEKPGSFSGAIQMLADTLTCSLFVLWLPLLFWVFIWSPVDSRGYGPEPAGAPGRGASVLPSLVLACHGLGLPVCFLPRPRGNCPVASMWSPLPSSALECPVTSSSRPFDSDSLLCLVLRSALVLHCVYPTWWFGLLFTCEPWAQGAWIWISALLLGSCCY